MPSLAIVGLQWGDEGKGKIIDFLSEKASLIARYQGGPNAGHTVRVKNKRMVFHQVPSGILHPHTIGVIGQGCVIDPAILKKEIESVEEMVGSISERLFVSPECHLIMPYHKIIDELRENVSSQSIGTTKRGVGPAYEDKYARVGLRVADLLSEETFRDKLKRVLAQKNLLLMEIYKAEPLKEREISEEYLRYQQLFKPLVRDVSLMIEQTLREGKRVIFEGAQGTLLDITYGTYPYVTSSAPTVGGICTGLGVGPKRIDKVLGVAKAYTTRVGYGPFPTEESETISSILRERGGEFGATTGRARRCGWFDAPAVRYSIRINGVDLLAITKLDVLDGFEEIKLAIGYKETDEFTPYLASKLSPNYITLKGWKRSTKGIKRLEDLPKEARRYLEKIEEEVHTPINLISLGEERDSTILLEDFF